MVEFKKKKKPTFNVLNLGFRKQVKARWRRPRGVANKKRRKNEFAGAAPRIGYRNPLAIRHLHPRGKLEMLIENTSALLEAKAKNMLVRIASKVGGKKRAVIVEKAKSLGLDIINE